MYNGARFEVEQKYTSFVNVTSRKVFPRVDTARLAQALTEAEAAAREGGTGQGEDAIAWVTERFVDSGPLTRLECPKLGRLTKAERYANPHERRIHPSSLAPEFFTRVVTSYFEFGLASAQRKEAWTWEELHTFNKSINWAEWRVPSST